MTTRPMDPDLAAILAFPLYLVARRAPTAADIAAERHPDVIEALAAAETATEAARMARTIAVKAMVMADAAERLAKGMRRAARVTYSRVRAIPSTPAEIAAQSSPLVAALQASASDERNAYDERNVDDERNADDETERA